MAARREGGGRRAALEAASRLFYAEGIEAVSVELVAAEAGLTKRAVYYHFPDKAALVAAYLAAAGPRSLDVLMRLAGDGPPGRARVLRLFARLGGLLGSPAFAGCAMLRASHDGEAGRAAAAAHKADVSAWFVTELSADDMGDAEARGRELLLVLDGALSDAVFMDAATIAADAARAAERIVGEPPGAG